MEPGEDLFAEDQDVKITNLSDNEQTDEKDQEAHQPTPRALLRPKHRWRILQLGAVLVAGMLCLLLFLQSTPGVGSALLRSLFGPTSTPTTAVSEISAFYIDASPSWGTLSIDGKKVAHLPIEKRDQPMRLAPGRHSFLWQAAPFPAQSCALTLPTPLGISGSCLTDETLQAPGGEPAMKIFFQNSLLTLPRQQQQALTTSIQQSLNTLSTSDIVQPGEHFLAIPPNSSTASSPIQIARQPLLGTLHFTLESRNDAPCTGISELHDCTTDGQSCYALCTPFGLACVIFCPPANAGASWYALAVVRLSWTYTTMDGQVVAANQNDALGGAASLAHPVVLRINWNGRQWQVQASPTFVGIPFACASTESDNNALGITLFDVVWHYLSSANNASGCLITVTPANGTATTGEPMIFLHRFGVDLAINTLAQQMNPNMSRPDAYEVQLAQQLEAHFPGSL